MGGIYYSLMRSCFHKPFVNAYIKLLLTNHLAPLKETKRNSSGHQPNKTKKKEISALLHNDKKQNIKDVGNNMAQPLWIRINSIVLL